MVGYNPDHAISHMSHSIISLVIRAQRLPGWPMEGVKLDACAYYFNGYPRKCDGID